MQTCTREPERCLLEPLCFVKHGPDYDPECILSRSSTWIYIIPSERASPKRFQTVNRDLAPAVKSDPYHSQIPVMPCMIMAMGSKGGMCLYFRERIHK